MPLCGFNTKMIRGIAQFAEGLFEATQARAKEQGLSLEQAFEIEVREISMFLEALENRHQELKKEFPPPETMKRAVDWITKNDR